MLKILANSFTFKGIFSLKNERKIKFIFYFIIIVLMISFPFSLQSLTHKGWDMNNMSTGFKETCPTWFPSSLPNGIEFSRNGVFGTEEFIGVATLGTGGEYTIIINPQSEYEIIDKLIVLGKEEVYYYPTATTEPFIGNYSHITEPFSTTELKQMFSEGKLQEAIDLFANIIDGSLARYYNYDSLLKNLLINFIMYIVLVLLVSVIFLMIRINYKKVTTFSENINIVISAMTIPSLITFFVGLLLVLVNQYSGTSFLQVIFQFATPLIALMAIFKGGKEKERSIKGL